MKHLIIIAIFSMVIGQVFSQVVTGPHYNNFEISENLDITIDTSLAENVWEVGTPNKVLFNSAYSVPLAIITDVNSFYPDNNYSTFQFTIPFAGYDLFPHFVILFRQKFDTDFKQDGGWIEASYDGGNNWTNVFADTVYHVETYVPPSGFYPDTLMNGQVAFRGLQNSWYEFEINFDNFQNPILPDLDSLLIRFVFYSDGNPSSKEGWVIDDVRVLRTLIVDGIEEGLDKNDINIFPNPASDILNIRLQDYSQGTLFIYNSSLLLIDSYDLSALEKSIDISQLDEGIYFVRLVGTNTHDGIHKFVKIKN